MTIEPLRPVRWARFVPAGLVLLTCVATGSAAGAYKTRAVGDWTVAPSQDGRGCFISRTYRHPGETTLLLGLDANGANHLTVLNANWSIKPKEQLKLDFRLSGSSYPNHFAVGLSSDGKQGFVTSFGPGFPAYVAKSRTLTIALGSTPVERLEIDRSDAAVAELRRCVTATNGPPAAATGKKTGSDAIPLDPFARTEKRGK